MRCIRLKPGAEDVELIDIPSGLGSLQMEVGGMIQAVYPWNDPVGLICNEEGKINEMEACCILADQKGRVYDIVHGPMLIVGLGEENFTDLTEEQVELMRGRIKKLNRQFVAFTDVEG